MRVFVRWLRIAVLLILLGLFAYGVKLGDFSEIRYNGSILCISCIGIK
jgi:hypothetical protein